MRVNCGYDRRRSMVPVTSSVETTARHFGCSACSGHLARARGGAGDPHSMRVAVPAKLFSLAFCGGSSVLGRQIFVQAFANSDHAPLRQPHCAS